VIIVDVLFSARMREERLDGSLEAVAYNGKIWDAS
jgi:hypothetical protein